MHAPARRTFCSISPVMSYYGQLAILPNGTANFFQNATHFRRNGRKKSSKPFSDLLLVCAAVMSGGYLVFNDEKRAAALFAVAP